MKCPAALPHLYDRPPRFAPRVALSIYRSPDEDEEQPASGAEERGHAEEADAEAGALTWQELFFSGGGAL